MPNLTKLEIARRQLGVATAMFVRNEDPVSIHCLACAAAEIAEALGRDQDVEIFTDHILNTYPRFAEGNRRRLREARGQYWNAFKHVFKTNQTELRDDDALLESFSDEQNDSALVLGWWDYAPQAGTLPIAAQVFQIWFFAMYEEEMDPIVDLTTFRMMFPDIRRKSRAEQKGMLRRKIEWAERQRHLVEAKATDRRPLVLRGL